jgi:hypothetical protein
MSYRSLSPAFILVIIGSSAVLGFYGIEIYQPTTLACMHGSAWKGDGAVVLRALGETLAS